MRRFFCPNIEETGIITGEEAAHILRVLRMREKDRLIVFNGRGKDFLCEIEMCAKNQVAVKIIEVLENQKKLDFELTLYQSVIKRDNMELVLQKATEIGINNFIAFISKRTVKRPDDEVKIKDKYAKVAAEAAKQCGRAVIPGVDYIKNINIVLEKIKAHELCILAYENEKTNIKKLINRTKAKDIAVIIGPEGGFEPEEAKMFTEAGAVSCGLGKLILRAETAAVSALSMIAYEKMETE